LIKELNKDLIICLIKDLIIHLIKDLIIALMNDLIKDLINDLINLITTSLLLCMFPLPYSKQSKAVVQVTNKVICTNIFRMVRMRQQKKPNIKS